MAISLKHVAMQLCTCTWIEIMTGAGITLYLLSMQNYALAAVTVAAFGPLIGFHFAIDRIKPGRDGGGWKKDEKEKKEKENNGRTRKDNSSKDQVVGGLLLRADRDAAIRTPARRLK